MQQQTNREPEERSVFEADEPDEIDARREGGVQDLTRVSAGQTQAEAPAPAQAQASETATAEPDAMDAHLDDSKRVDASDDEKTDAAHPEVPDNCVSLAAHDEQATAAHAPRFTTITEAGQLFNASSHDDLSPDSEHPQQSRVEAEHLALPTSQALHPSHEASQIDNKEPGVDPVTPPAATTPALSTTEADRSEDIPVFEESTQPDLVPSRQLEEVVGSAEQKDADVLEAFSHLGNTEMKSDLSDNHEGKSVKPLVADADLAVHPAASKDLMKAVNETPKEMERNQLDKDIERALNARRKSISSTKRPKLGSISSTSLASERSQQGQSTPTKPLQSRPSLIFTGPNSPASPGFDAGENGTKKIGASFNRVSPTLKARLAGTFSNDSPVDPQSPTQRSEKLVPAPEPPSPSKRSKLLSEAKRILSRKKSMPDTSAKATPGPQEHLQQEMALPIGISQQSENVPSEPSSLVSAIATQVETTSLTPVSEAPSEATISPGVIETAEKDEGLTAGTLSANSRLKEESRGDSLDPPSKAKVDEDEASEAKDHVEDHFLKEEVSSEDDPRLLIRSEGRPAVSA
jgi:hypothetical protein